MSLINFLEAEKTKIERGNMPDIGAIARAAKRVTMDDIYVSLDALKDQQSEDSRHLNTRIDTMSQKIDTQISQVSQRVDNLGTRIDSLGTRMDAMMGMLFDISKQIIELSKQKNQ